MQPQSELSAGHNIPNPKLLALTRDQTYDPVSSTPQTLHPPITHTHMEHTHTHAHQVTHTATGCIIAGLFMYNDKRERGFSSAAIMRTAQQAGHGNCGGMRPFPCTAASLDALHRMLKAASSTSLGRGDYPREFQPFALHSEGLDAAVDTTVEAWLAPCRRPQDYAGRTGVEELVAFITIPEDPSAAPGQDADDRYCAALNNDDAQELAALMKRHGALPRHKLRYADSDGLCGPSGALMPRLEFMGEAVFAKYCARGAGRFTIPSGKSILQVAHLCNASDCVRMLTAEKPVARHDPLLSKRRQLCKIMLRFGLDNMKAYNMAFESDAETVIATLVDLGVM